MYCVPERFTNATAARKVVHCGSARCVKRNSPRRTSPNGCVMNCMTERGHLKQHSPPAQSDANRTNRPNDREREIQPARSSGSQNHAPRCARFTATLESRRFTAVIFLGVDQSRRCPSQTRWSGPVAKTAQTRNRDCTKKKASSSDLRNLATSGSTTPAKDVLFHLTPAF